MTADQAAARQASHENLQRILLRELEMAHQIILNGLALMTPEQKNAWAEMNAASGSDSAGTTRYHERLAAIERAKEQA
ncbi:hypothetical protein [Cupriavidus basilensis]